MIKGALFDIDDTLYSHELNCVPKATMKMLDKLRAKGIKIGVCTSRIAAEMNNFPDDLLSKIDCKIVGTGATTIIDNEYIKSYTIDLDLAKKYTDYFNSNQISYHYTDINGDVYYWGDFDQVNNGRWLRYAQGNVKFKEYEDELITNLFYYQATDEEVAYIDSINPDANISKWGNSGNICASLVDKSFGLLKFCQVFSLTTDEVVAAGDGSNDDVMLEMAGIGVAVSDAKDNTKACADYICDKSIEDGGLYNAFVDLGIIQEDEYDIKMFVFDNDSTLFDHRISGVSKKTYEALYKLKENGYILCLNTSRALEELKNIPAELFDIMDSAILLNGAYIIKDDEILKSYLSDDTTRNLIRFFEENDVTYRYVTSDGKGYLNRHDEDKEDIFRKLYDMVPPVKEYEGEKLMHILYYAQGPLRQQINDIAINEETCNLRIAGEISPKGLNKGSAMLKLAIEYGLDDENICAFGDSGNDIAMMKIAKLGIAVGNASQSCKDEADYICDDISNDGIYKALVHFGFIKE